MSYPNLPAYGFAFNDGQQPPGPDNPYGSGMPYPHNNQQVPGNPYGGGLPYPPANQPGNPYGMAYPPANVPYPVYPPMQQQPPTPGYNPPYYGESVYGVPGGYAPVCPNPTGYGGPTAGPQFGPGAPYPSGYHAPGGYQHGSGAMGYNPPAAPTGPTGEYPGAYPNLDGSMNSSEYHDPTDEETDLYEVDDYDSTPTSREPTPARSFGSVSPMPMTSQETPLPTVTPADPFDAQDDADRLHQAFKGFGSDKDTIIDILCRRTSAQRVEIVRMYKTMFGKDLQKRLISELSGDLEKVMVALTLPLPEYLAAELHHDGVRETALVQIVCSATNCEIHAISDAYSARYGKTLESDVKKATSGDFERIMVALLQGMRDDDMQPDRAAIDAKRLYSAGEGRLGTDESTFISIMASRSWPQLCLIAGEYARLSGRSLEKAITSEFSGSIESALLAILRCASNRWAYLAACLRATTAGMGTSDRDLIRLLVSRCDIDLGSIKLQYRAIYGKDLAHHVSDDTSGHYRKALLTLIG